jgi:hypothetical protein
MRNDNEYEIAVWPLSGRVAVSLRPFAATASFLGLALLGGLHPALAQSRALVEFTAGYAAFVDDAPIEHAIAGAGARFHVSPRISIGPEAIYMRGPGSNRDFYLTGNITIDLGPADGRSAMRRVVPFVVGGAGYSRQWERIGAQPFSSGEIALTGGGGIRVRIDDRWHAAGEVRTGWEPHIRVSGTIGVALRR